MATYIKLASGLVQLDSPVTSASISQALGYTPSNFSGSYNDLTDKPLDGDILTSNNSVFYIADNNENIIALIDENGVHSIDFDINGKSVKDHIEDKDVHITPEEREKWNDPLSSNDSELYITDNNGNILALFNTDGLTISAIKTNTINGVDANDLVTKDDISTINSAITAIETKTDNIEASENDSTFIITDSAGNAVAQFDDSGLTVTAVKTNDIDTNNINGTAVDEFSTKAELDAKAQELQSAINTHIANKANPHEVTAAQVGAYTTDEADRLFASIEHNHDDVYSKLDHTHTFENTIVSAGLNIDVSNSGLNYTVAVKDDINLTSVTAEEIIVSQISKNDDILVIQDDDENPIFQVDKNGVTTYGIKTNEISATKLNGTEISQFATQSYTEENFAALGHNHDSVYSKLTHNHDAKYSDINHNHAGVYADFGHNHDGDYADINHNHDSVYADIDHTHELPTVSEGNNINVTKTNLDYKVALASEIELTKVKATTISADILETPTLLQDGDNLSVSDVNGNIVAQIDSSGLVVTEVKATKATVYDESSKQYEAVMTPTAVDNRINSVIATASDTESITNLTSLVDYLDKHGTEAAEMLTSIENLEKNKANKADLTNSMSNSAGKTVASLTQTDGVINATFQDISITENQISDLKHSTVSNGDNVTVTESNRNYTVELNDEITLTKVNADTVTTDVLETPTVLQDGDTFAVQDPNGHTIAQIDESGLSTTAVYVNGKEVATKEELLISGTVTKDIGGIKKDKTYTNAELSVVLSDLLFPYVAPTMSYITLSEAAGTFEYGTERIVSTVTPYFTKGSKNITSIKIGTTSGGVDLYSGTSATSEDPIDLTSKKTYDGTTGGTIYCTISDGTQSVSASAKISYVYYNYVIVTNSTTIPTSRGSGRNLAQSCEVSDLVTSDNSYIWFLMPNQNKTQIQEYAMNQWNNVSTIAAGSVTFTTDTDEKFTYYAYRTDKMMSNTSKYRIN